MRWLFGAVIFVSSVLLPLALLGGADAATPTLSGLGTPVTWTSRRLEIAGNPRNRSGLSAGEVFSAAVRGLQRWSEAARGSVSFDYWQGSDPAQFETQSTLDGHNNLYFASQSKGGADVDPQVLGLTQVWFNASTREILEADIVLNDLHYQLTTSGITTDSAVSIENILTHELGHALGLSHSGVMQSTMLFMEGPDQAHLGCDDQTGIRGIYGVVSGSIRARVTDPGGSPLLGAQVVAISRQAGTVMGSGLSDRDGIARIIGLDDGTYDLMVEPYFAGPSPLPIYYSSMNAKVCAGGGFFARTFRLASGGHPLGDPRLLPVNVEGGRESDAGSIRVRCESARPLAGQVAPQFPLLQPGESNGAQVGQVERSGKGPSFRLESLGGPLTIRLLSFSLYSPVAVRGVLYSSSGVRVGAQEFYPVYRSESGFADYDSELRFANLAPGIYRLQVQAREVPIQDYPAGLISRDPDPFFVVQATAQLAEAGPDPKCRQRELFAPYASPPGPPPRHTTTGAAMEGALGCGTIRPTRPTGSPRPDPPSHEAEFELAVLAGLLLAITRLSRQAVASAHLRA